MPQTKGILPWALAAVACLSLAPAAARAYTREALAQYAAGQEDEADEQWAAADGAYRAALRADPTLTIAYKALAAACYREGDCPAALHFYDLYLASHPRDSAAKNFAEGLRESPAESTSGYPPSEIVENDGAVLRGTVEGYRRGDFIRIRTQDGKLYEVQWGDILEFNGKRLESAAPAPLERPFWQKSWYLDVLDLGFTKLGYPTATTRALDALRALPGGTSAAQMSINFLGFYWPVGDSRKLLLGFEINGLADPVVQGDGQSWQLNQYIYAFSSMYFPLGRIGDGLYVVGNFGPAAAEEDGYSSDGVGLLAGCGYLFPVGDAVRPRVELNASVKSIDAGSPTFAAGIYQSLGLDFGLLW